MENINNSVSQQVPVPKDKRPMYIWWLVILANIGIYLVAIINELYSYDRYDSIGEYLVKPFVGFGTQNVWILIIWILICVVPIIISKLTVGWKHLIGYGIPSLVALFSLVHFFTCTGKFCNFIDIPIIAGAIIFAILYALGIYFAKWNVKVVLSFLWIEIVLLVVGVGFIGYLLAVDASFKEKLSINSSKDFSEIFQICDSAPDYGGRSYHCIEKVWTGIIDKNPGKDVCSWATTESSKNICTQTMASVYQSKDRCEEYKNYYDKESGTSNEEENYRKMKSCWIEKSQKYPSIDICGSVYGGDNNQKCRDVVRGLSK
ncbi:hypothetical protein EPO17_01490 [Patescibacteria group bacterium]|nr:MAG: hypothetical protein EPO17_01490 [Patescibacteria group bacterium]